MIVENVAFEELPKPIMDLNLPMMDVDKLLEDQKATDEILNYDL